jgi:hypothetical protein
MNIDNNNIYKFTNLHNIMEYLVVSKKVNEIKNSAIPTILDDYEGIIFARGSCGNKPC